MEMMEEEEKAETDNNQNDSPLATKEESSEGTGLERSTHDSLALHEGLSQPPSSSGLSDTPHASSTLDSGRKPQKKPAKPKLTPEQKEKLAAIEVEKERARTERVNLLAKDLVTFIRPFVEAKNPGDVADSETTAFEKKTRLEAEDLKLESFGVELLHTIGNVYITKATNYVRSKKFFGGGFIGRLREKGSMLKEGWGLLGSALVYHTTLLTLI
jgi:hypothetical protein